MKRALSLLLLLPLAVFGQITAKSWLVADSTGTVLQGENTSAVRSIASITKLLTVMVVLDSDQSLDESIKTPKYKSITRRTLIDLALVSSDNGAADSLCRSYPTGYSGCIQAMNDKAAGLSMVNTRVFDATGLNAKNVSTADDLLRLVQSASTYPIVVEAGTKGSMQVTNKGHTVTLSNTNPLISQGYPVIVSKTGFIRAAGGCLVVMVNTLNGIRTVILLGSKNTHTRAPEVALLSEKIYEDPRIN